MIAPDQAQRLAQDQELIRAEMDGIKQQVIVIDSRQRNEMLSLTRAFLLVDQAVAQLRSQIDEHRKANAEQDKKLIQTETLLSEVRASIGTAIKIVAIGFGVVAILLFVIALRG